MANLLDFRLHRRWSEKLIETRMAVQLDTHAQVSFAQLEAADHKFFQELADRTREGVQSPHPYEELLGCRSCTNRGDPICFGYGLKTCTEPVKGGRCPKGLHVCAVPKCGGARPALDCPHYASVRKGSS